MMNELFGFIIYFYCPMIPEADIIPRKFDIAIRCTKPNQKTNIIGEVDF
jgi:hypothetical protein